MLALYMNIIRVQVVTDFNFLIQSFCVAINSSGTKSSLHAQIHTHMHAHAHTHTHTHKHTGTGCIVNSVKHGSGREPTVVGKPYNPIFEVIQHSTKLDPAKTLMIGDRWAVVCITSLN